MNDCTIEHAGMHYASHTLLDVQRELQRELDKERDACALVTPGENAEVCSSPVNPVAAKQTSADAMVSAPADEPAAGIDVECNCVGFPYIRNGKATDLLDRLGHSFPADHTARQLEVPPSAPAAVPLETADAMPAAAVDDCQDLCRTREEDNANCGEVEMDEDETAAVEFVKRHPRYYSEFVAVYQQVREHRRQRESLESLEDRTRFALGDQWCLQWESIFDDFLTSRRRAAESMRARLSKAHWREHLEMRPEKPEQAVAQRSHDAVFHDETILTELESAQYVQWQIEQLASFVPSAPLTSEAERSGAPLSAEEGSPSSQE